MLTHVSRPIPGDIAQPKLERAVITNIIVDPTDNSLIFQVNTEKGDTYDNVRFLANCSGSQSSYLQPGFEKGDEVYILTTTANAAKFILGSVFKSGINVTQTTPIQAPQNTNVKTASTSDYIIENGGNRLNLSKTNGIVLDANESVRIQLGNNGFFRISQNGVADELVLNGQEFVDTIHAYLSEIRAKYRALEATVDTLQDQVAQIANVTLGISSTLQGAFTAVPPGGEAAALAAVALAMTTTHVPNATAADNLSTFVQDDLNEALDLPLRLASTAKVESLNTLNPIIRIPKK